MSECADRRIGMHTWQKHSIRQCLASAELWPRRTRWGRSSCALLAIMGAFMSYVLVPQEQGVTRLLIKVVMRTARWAALGLSIGDLIMARRQLLNWKQLA